MNRKTDRQGQRNGEGNRHGDGDGHIEIFVKISERRAFDQKLDKRIMGAGPQNTAQALCISRNEEEETKGWCTKMVTKVGININEMMDVSQ